MWQKVLKVGVHFIRDVLTSFGKMDGSTDRRVGVDSEISGRRDKCATVLHGAQIKIRPSQQSNRSGSDPTSLCIGNAQWTEYRWITWKETTAFYSRVKEPVSAKPKSGFGFQVKSVGGGCSVPVGIFGEGLFLPEGKGRLLEEQSSALCFLHLPAKTEGGAIGSVQLLSIEEVPCCNPWHNAGQRPQPITWDQHYQLVICTAGGMWGVV